MNGPGSQSGPVTRRIAAAQALGWVVAVALTAPGQIAYFRALSEAGVGPLGFIFGVGLDSTLFFLVLLAGPLMWFWPTTRHIENDTPRPIGIRRSLGMSTQPVEVDDRAGAIAWTMALGVALASLLMSAQIAAMRVGDEQGLRFGELPPAYHDEYSYLFQAKTFLAGRLSFPSHPTMPELFDQMHVLNEGRFASRYFPGTGTWMAPFLAIGHPYWGHWLAGALTAMFTFWAGRELGGNGVGLLAGLLTALSPGLGLFSNLLLAHHPTLAALSLFVWMFLRMQRTGRGADFLLCGFGLAFAMLCRPMTAAGVALPFGIWHLKWLLRGSDLKGSPASFSARFLRTLLLGAPIIAGLVFSLLFNQAITGNMRLSPYQLYTDTYTPRHVYGFNNVVRGEQKLGPKVIDNYDRWAENLTPGLALRNTRDRFLACSHWTFSLPLLAAAGVLFFPLFPGHDRRWVLMPAGIISLFSVHVPYWFVGIMNWHYVFESAPLWLLVFAGVTQWLWDVWRQTGRRLLPAWWLTLCVIGIAVPYFSDEPGSLRSAVNEVAFSRLKYAQFQRVISKLESRSNGPVLILVEADPADRSIDYVANDPDLQDAALVGRYRPGVTDLDRVRREFPDRTIWMYRAQDRRVMPLEALPQAQ